MIKFGLFTTRSIHSGLALVIAMGAGILSGCSVVRYADDPCALANREVSFSILVENSMANTYNACLNDRREEIIKEWGRE